MSSSLHEVIIRQAIEKDLEELLTFEQGVINAERPFDLTLKREKTSYYDLPALIASPQAKLLVAEIDNKIVASGYARIEKSQNYLQHKYHAYLGFIYVVPEFRGRRHQRTGNRRAKDVGSLARYKRDEIRSLLSKYFCD